MSIDIISLFLKAKGEFACCSSVLEFICVATPPGAVATASCRVYGASTEQLLKQMQQRAQQQSSDAADVGLGTASAAGQSAAELEAAGAVFFTPLADAAIDAATAAATAGV